VSKRAALGIARTGGIAHRHSGNLILAFSTQSPATNARGLAAVKFITQAAHGQFVPVYY
jgi:L-aminopeptidase/D-esterase-like protein